MDNQTKDTLFSAAKGYLGGFVVEKGLEFFIPGLDIADGVLEIAGAVWCAFKSRKKQIESDKVCDTPSDHHTAEQVKIIPVKIGPQTHHEIK
ncbi:MAG TPA: hypothetical protein PLK94_00060 [Alphaproteobacteria bacterium]|nr:hypothetical protein [Alphaproteobacteria bacterium]